MYLYGSNDLGGESVIVYANWGAFPSIKEKINRNNTHTSAIP